MKPSLDGQWLNRSLESLHLSDAFKKTATQHGFHTIGELLAIPLTEAINIEWFTPAMFEELAWLVKNHPSTPTP